MTTHDRDKVIAAAKEADEDFTGDTSFNLGDSIVGINAIERFYAIAYEAGRVAEREECAAIAETPVSGEQDDITMEAKDRVAKAIRARSTK